MPDKVSFDFYARYACEALMLQQPQLEVVGLFRCGDRFVVLCPNLTKSMTTSGGELLAQWFHDRCRPVTCPIELVRELSEGFQAIPLRTGEQRARLHGEPLTTRDFSRELWARLPADFPLSRLEPGGGKVIACVSRPLLSAEQQLVDEVAADFALPIEVQVAPDATHEAAPASGKQQLKGVAGLALPSSRSIKAKVSSQVATLYEEDEDYWLSQREAIFCARRLARYEGLTTAFQPQTSACFIDASVFPPHNIRSYLPLYQRLVIAMPLAENLASALQHFNVSQRDLLALVARGRVQFVLPQPLTRYDFTFVARAAEARPDGLLFSRRLAAAALTEARVRLPFMYPSFAAAEKQQFLRAFTDVADTKFQSLAQVFATVLGGSWVNLEYNWNTRGAMAALHGGTGTLWGELIQAFEQRDVRIELGSASASVQWAAAVGATYCSFHTEGYSDYAAAQLCASLYSGVRDVPVIQPMDRLAPRVEGVLTLDNDAPVLEVDDVFTARDIKRLQAILADTAQTNTLAELNEKIQRFECNQARLKRLDVMGLGGAAATALTGNVYVPLAMWFMHYVLQSADPSRDPGGPLLDWCRAVSTFTTPDAVLVSRLRCKISTL